MSAGYGYGMSALSKLSTGRRVSGARLIAEAIYRRLTTPRGTVANAPTYGLDLSAYLGAVGGQVAIAALPAIIESEVLKDDRVASVEVTVVRDATTKSESLEITLSVTPVDEFEEFDLTLAVSDVDTTIVGGLP